MSAEQARGVLAAVHGRRLEPLYRVALATGLRQGELLALRWHDIELDRAQLSVTGSMPQGSRTVAATKTPQSRRTVSLDPETVAMLRVLRAGQVRTLDRDKDFVFRTLVGTPIGNRNLVRDWHAALARAGLPRMPFHQLRHGYATLMLEAGMDIAVVSKSLGHSTISTTADVYMHLTPATSRQVADRMGAILRG